MRACAGLSVEIRCQGNFPNVHPDKLIVHAPTFEVNLAPFPGVFFDRYFGLG
jgi:hypothetical protein